MKRNIDTDPSIEQRLFSSASQVEVKTTSAQILKAYQAKPQEKKDMIESSSPLYTKLWVKIALPLGCTACACAIGLGTYFGTLPKTVSEDVPLLTNVSSKLLYEVNTATPVHSGRSRRRTDRLGQPAFDVGPFLSPAGSPAGIRRWGFRSRTVVGQ
jgi:hypothetical protein